MAKIKRDFFIPYIKNICALHLLQEKLFSRKEQIEYQIEVVRRGQPEPAISRPYYEAEWTVGRCAAIVIAVLFAMIGLIAVFTVNDMPTSFYLFHVFCIGMSFVAIGCAIKLVKEDKEANEFKAAQFEEAQQEVKRIREKNERRRKQEMPGLLEELGECNSTYSAADRMLEKAYGANVIPGQYRNIHAVIYLYDWFYNSIEDDLGMALNTFVLEQIKDRLDDIIRNQGEILLNQQMQLSLQMQSNEERERHHHVLEQKLDRLQLTEEERSQNMDMVARTNSTLTWYAQQEYIRNMFR